MQVKDLRLKRALRTALLVLLLSAAGMGKMYAQDFTVGDLNYHVNDDGISVTLTGHVDGESATGILTIPEIVTYEGVNYSVTTIGDYAFCNCRGLTGSLFLPNSVTSIGNHAFWKCSGFIGTLTIPNSMTTIGDYAFVDCSGFTGSLTIPNSVTSIGNGAFADCSGFTGGLTISNSVITIGDNAFQYCSGFTGNLTIGNSVTLIGDYAFWSCSGFTGSLTIPNSVTTIGNSAFSIFNDFSFIVCFSETPPVLGNSVFGWNSNTPVYVPCGFDEVYSSLLWGGFSNFYGLCAGTVIVDVEPEEGGTVIGGGTFEGGAICTVTAIANEGYTFERWINNGISVSTDAEYSFYVAGDTSLLAHFVPEGNIVFADANVKGICISHWDTNGDDELSFEEAAAVASLGNYFQSNTQITSFEELQYFIGLSFIGDYEFSDCNNLSGNLIIPNSVTTIGNYAFCNCSGLTGNLIIPNSVTTIGDFAFSNCSGFTGSLTIPNSVIYLSGFGGCTGLTGGLIIPNSVTTIGESAFSNTRFTGSLTIPNSVTSISRYAFSRCSGFTGSLTISNSVTSIGERAFLGCSGFTGSLTIPNSVTSIGNDAFTSCGFNNLEIDMINIPGRFMNIIGNYSGSLTIGNSVTSIGWNAFYGCSGLIGDLFIPNSVITIEEGAFRGCSGFTGSLTISNSVTSIGRYAFQDCSGFSEVYYNATNCANVEYSDYYSPFKGCGGTLTIGNNVERIPNYMFCSEAFIGDLSIPNSVTTIGNGAFYNCSGFTGRLTIGNSVTSIGNSAFHSCSGLTSMIVFTEMPPVLDYSVFFIVNKSIPVYVPNGTVSAYQTTFGWSEFTNIQEYGSCPITFADANVKVLCIANWDTNGDYELSYDEAAAVTDLGEVFRENTEITSFEELKYFMGLTTISGYSFSNCSNLTGSLFIPNSVTTIGDNAFAGCSDFTSMTILVEMPPLLGSNVFYNVNKTIPVFVACGASSAYQNASGWSEFTNIQEYESCPITFADANVKAICVANWDTNADGELSFDEAASVTDLGEVFSENTEITSFEELQYFTGLTTIDDYAFSNCSNLTGSLFIPNSVTTIGIEAFYNCSGFTGNLVIPNSVTTIGSSAFEGCSGFTGSLSIGDSVITIDERAFYDCSGFTGDLVIPNSVTVIGQWAFCNCSGFTGSLTLGNALYSIDYGAFAYCSGFSGSLIIPNSITTILDYAFSNCIGFTGNLIIPNSVTYLSGFDGCTGFTGELIIPNSVTTIGNWAFSNCNGFTGSLTIPNSVTTINEYAFHTCRSFTGILTIGNSVTTIGDCAFCYCNGFTGSLTIPNSVITIGHDAFCYCSGFTGNLDIPNSVTSIGIQAFNGCSGFSGNLTISNSVTTIGKYTFGHCNGFTGELIIPNSVTSIGWGAFWGCSGFTGSLTIGNSVTTIDDYAFCSCNGFTEAIMLGANPPILGNSVFSGSYPIYVPYESLNDYKTATNWSTYEDRIFPMAYTTIPGYGEGEGNYRFIASPLVENTAPTTVDNMITETPYDLYLFDQSAYGWEWQNYKANTESFVLENGQGYLYANAEEVNVIFKGEFNEDDTKEVELAYDANATFAGWNLVGNPFPVSAYANKSYYTMNEDGTGIEPNMVSSATAIPACTGVMVKAEDQGESVVFNTTAPETASNQGGLRIVLSQVVEPVETPIYRGDGPSTGSGTLQDKAIISFNRGDRLEKFVFNKNNARISIPQGGKDLAIACAEKQSEMPLNFKATKNGTYTLSVDVENADVDYLHLIDNLTGADVDLLVGPNYTFEAKSTDYASRFRLVFSVCGDADGDNGTFAFISNGNIIVTGAEADAVLQIVDVTGRILVSRKGDAIHRVSTNGMTPGVYVLRLINGNDIKTQKIVID